MESELCVRLETKKDAELLWNNKMKLSFHSLFIELAFLDEYNSFGR